MNHYADMGTDRSYFQKGRGFMKRAKKGFTLIEVICVLVIIAIVAVIAVPNISRYIDNSKINNCKSTMSGFLNDLEYKIVSKRYYDIDELNKELVGVAEAAADSLTSTPVVSTGDDGKFASLEETITDAKGICPNGGHYTIEWTIKPGDSDNANTAKVDIKMCECDCMHEHVHLEKSYVFTAALISKSDYLKSNVPIDETYKNYILEIIAYINEHMTNPDTPEKIDDIIKQYEEEYPECPYDIKGVTVRSERGHEGEGQWVEWICVDLNKNYDYSLDHYDKSAHDFISYYPSPKGNGSGKLVVTPLSEDEASTSDYWPPVEGNSGSYYYLQGLDYEDNKTYNIADVSKADTIQWLQRDGNWYVERKFRDSTEGIDSGKTISDEEKENYSLISSSMLNTSKGLSVEISDKIANPTDFDLRDIFTVYSYYKDGTSKSFGHIMASDLTTDNPNDYFIQNGYIIVDSEDAVNDKIWTGVFSDDSEETIVEAAEQRENLKELLKDEEDIIGNLFSDVASGVFGDGTDDNGKYKEITIAYQEYYKTIDNEGNYTYTPYTSYGKVKFYEKTDENNQVVPGANIVVEKGGVKEAIGSITISNKDEPDSCNISIKNESEDGGFDPNNLVITKEIIYSLEDENDIVKATKTETITLTPGVDYYIGTDPDSDDPNVTKQSVDAINNNGLTSDGSPEKYYIYDPKTNTPLAIITEGSLKKDTLSCSYDKKDGEEQFFLDKEHIKVYIDSSIKITNLSNNKSVETGASRIVFDHKTSDDQDGWYLECIDSEDKNLSESDLLDKINKKESNAVIKLYKAGEGDNKIDNIMVFNIETDLDHLSETHSIYDTTRSTMFGRLVSGVVNLVTNRVSNENDTYVLYLDVTAHYVIYVKGVNDKSNSEIEFTKQLNHDSNTSDDRRYRLYNKDVSGDGPTITAESKFNLNTVADGDTLYVYYTDDETVKLNFRFLLKKIPDFIYFKDSKNKKIMHITAYIGSDSDINIPSEVTGYWQYGDVANLVHGIVLGENYEVYEYNHTMIYYVNDGNKYKVSYAGFDDKTKENVDYEAKYNLSSAIGAIGNWLSGRDVRPPREFHIVNSDVNGNENKIIRINDGVKIINEETFKNIKCSKIILPSSLTTICNNAFDGATISGGEDYEFVISKNVTSIESEAFKGFTIEKGTLVINGGSDSNGTSVNTGKFTGAKMEKLRFGSEAEGAKVKSVQSEVFKNNGLGKSLELGSLKTIGANAFYGWNNATEDLVIPSSVTKIDSNAFAYFASNITDVNDYPSLTINGGSNEREIEGAVFKKSHFNNVSIGGNVTSIKPQAFENSSGDYSAFTGKLSIGNSVQMIGPSAFKKCIGFTGTLTLPENNNYTTIDIRAFDGCKGFTGDLVIPENVTTINNNAFSDCSNFDGKLILSSNLDSIGVDAFNGCKKIVGGLTIPQSVTSISNNAFSNFAQNTTEAGELVVLGGSKDNGETLGTLVFNGAKFNGIKIAGKVNTIDSKAFHNDGSQYDYSRITGNLEIGDSVISIGESAFELMGVTSLSGLKNVEYIGNKAFKNCRDIESDLKFSDDGKLKSIGEETFRGDNKIKSVRIPNTVINIGNSAFDDSGSGESLEIYGGTKNQSTGKIILGNGSNSIFNNANYRNVIIGGNVEEIGYAFMKHDTDRKLYYDNIKGNLTIKGKVSKITEEAFFGTGFDGVLTFEGNSLAEIGKSAFENQCYMHGNLTIPMNVHSIGVRAFKKFGASVTKESELGTLTILGYSENDEDHTIGYRIFSKARFKTVQIGGIDQPSTVHAIGNFAFYNSLKAYTGNSLEDYQGTHEFEDMSRYGFSSYEYKLNDDLSNYSNFAKNVRIGEGIRTIGIGAFENCSCIENVNMMKNTTELTIRQDAFRKCTNAGQGLTIPKNVISIEDGAFVEYGSETNKTGKLEILGCSTLEDGTHVLGNSSGTIFSGAKFNNVEIGGNVEIVGSGFMKTDTDTDYSRITGNLIFKDNVIEIRSGAFENTCFSGSLQFGSVEIIGARAFSGWNNATDDLLIPDTVKSIKEKAFDGYASANSERETYPSLTIYGGSNGNKLGGVIFTNGHYKNVTIGGNVTTVDGLAFDNESGTYNELIGELTLEESVSSIKEKAFYYVGGFDTITIPKSVETIERYAFDWTGSGKGSLTIYGCSQVVEGTHILGNGTDTLFNHANFRDVTIGGNVEVIGDRFMKTLGAQYYYNGMTGTLKIESPVKTIGIESFYGDTGFSSLVIPETVISIGNSAFDYYGSGEGSLTINGCSNDKNSINNIDGLNTIEPGRFKYAKFHNVTIGGNVEKIADGFMNNFDSNKNTFGDIYAGISGDLIIGESVQKIGNEAFWDCIAFDGKLVIGQNVNSIGESAFSGCRGLYTSDDIKPEDRKLEIPESVSYMGNFAFKALGENLGTECNDSIGYKFPALYIYGSSQNDGSLGGPENRAIFSNARFKNVTIGRNVTSIADDFMNNSKHQTKDDWYISNDEFNSEEQYSFIFGDLEILSSVKSIGKNAFNSVQCSQKFDESETSEGHKYISYRGKLILNEGLESIGEGAFANTKFFGDTDISERSLTIPSTVTYIGKGAFENFCSTFWNPPSLTIYGYTDGRSTASEGVRKMIEPGIFDYSCFRNVTIGGNVYCIDGLAFNDNQKYSKWTGTLTFEAESVGYDGNSYHSDAMSYGDNWGPFRGCKFDNVTMPDELYQALDSAKDYDTRNGLFGNSTIPVN